MSVSYSNYLSMDDYEKKNANIKASTYGINQYSLIRSAIIVGLATKGYHNLAKEVKEWKIKSIDAFVDMNSKPFKIKNIEQLETSEKITVSYFIGMVFAHLHMEKYYGIRHLEHLKNEGIKAIPYKERMERPDLWGFNRHTMNSYLVEAKGSTTPKKFFDKYDIKKAEKQLKAIKQIGYQTNLGKSYIFNEGVGNLNKFIVATHPNRNNEVTQHIVDPKESQGIKLNINGDESIFKYYYNLISWLKSDKHRKVTIELKGKKKSFITIDVFDLNVSIGVLEDIYNYFDKIIKDEKIYESDDFSGADEKINEILNELVEVDDFAGDISLGIDGVIVFENKMEGNNLKCLNGKLVGLK